MCVQAAAYMKILPLTLTSVSYVRPHPHLTLPNLYSYPIEDIRSEILLHHDPHEDNIGVYVRKGAQMVTKTYIYTDTRQASYLTRGKKLHSSCHLKTEGDKILQE